MTQFAQDGPRRAATAPGVDFAATAGFDSFFGQQFRRGKSGRHRLATGQKA
jgi:hypothetical protein